MLCKSFKTFFKLKYLVVDLYVELKLSSAEVGPVYVILKY